MLELPEHFVVNFLGPSLFFRAGSGLFAGNLGSSSSADGSDWDSKIELKKFRLLSKLAPGSLVEMIMSSWIDLKETRLS